MADNEGLIGVPDSATKGDIDAADKAADAQADAALDRILGEESGGNAGQQPGVMYPPEPGERTYKAPSREQQQDDAGPTDGPARGADGKFAAKAVNKDDYAKAYRALRFDGFSDEDIDAIPMERMVKLGLKRASNHADVDRIKTKNAELERQAAGKDELSEPSTEGESDTFDWNAAVAPLVELYGDDAAEPLIAFGKAIRQQTESQAPQAPQANEQVQELKALVQRVEQADARRTLAKKWGLDDPQRWQQALEARKADTNEYGSEMDAISSACRQCFADEVIASYQRKLGETHAARDAGQPYLPPSETRHASGAPTRGEKSQDQLEDDLLDALFDGERETAERISRTLKGRTTQISSSEAMVGVMTDQP